MFNQIRNTIVKNSDNNLVYKVINRVLFDKHLQPKLGRWGLIHDDRVDRKVDWSNEDHCGPCGSLKLEKKDFKK